MSRLGIGVRPGPHPRLPALVAHVATEPRTARLVGGIIGLFQAIDIDVVADGIEDGHQYLMLSSLGCHYAQGFYAGRPVVWSRYRSC